jgi:hypothetical protein
VVAVSLEPLHVIISMYAWEYIQTCI